MTHRCQRSCSALAGMAGLAALAAAYSIVVEPFWFAIRHYEVPVLEKDVPPLRVLHLSDLHMLERNRRKQRFVRALAQEPVDLVVVTGDMLGEPEGLGPVLDVLGHLRPRLGSAAVLGSNDYYAPRPKNYLSYFSRRRKRGGAHRDNPHQELVQGLRDRGWIVLINETAVLGDLDLAGVDDPHLHREDMSVLVSPQRPTRARVGLSHSPEPWVLDAFAGSSYRLALAGHTHGGQLRIPGFGALVTNCDLPRKHARGLFRHGSLWVHVSAGLGTSKYAPFRFACRPEATFLELVAAEQPHEPESRLFAVSDSEGAGQRPPAGTSGTARG